MRGTFTAVLAAASLGALVLSAPAQAAFPGADGKIAFASDRDGVPQIYTMRPDGSEVTRLTFDDVDDERPAWSPDGTKIAFESFRDGNSEVYVMNADGSGVVNLSDTPFPDIEPAWSPDGTKITF